MRFSGRVYIDRIPPVESLENFSDTFRPLLWPDQVYQGWMNGPRPKVCHLYTSQLFGQSNLN